MQSPDRSGTFPAPAKTRRGPGSDRRVIAPVTRVTLIHQSFLIDPSEQSESLIHPLEAVRASLPDSCSQASATAGAAANSGTRAVRRAVASRVITSVYPACAGSMRKLSGEAF